MDDCIGFYFDQGLTQTEIALCLSVIDDLHISVSNFMMEISAASAYTIIFARNIHKVRDFLAIATITLWENGFYFEIHNFRYVEITRKLSRDNDKTTFVMSRSQEN